jgi:isopropylmalate/homocitrate/citramalate synthase
VAEQLFPASQLLSDLTGATVQANKAITGRNAFAHEAGIHQDGMLKNPLTYEIMTPHSVGVPDSRLVLGKHSGRHALGLRCEQLGFQFDRRELDEIYRRFVVLADKIKHVEEHHLLELIQQARTGADGGSGQVEAAPVATVARHSYSLKPFPAPLIADFKLPSHPSAERHADQEDYLWGV